jgi:hypothetical protein
MAQILVRYLCNVGASVLKLFATLLAFKQVEQFVSKVTTQSCAYTMFGSVSNLNLNELVVKVQRLLNWSKPHLIVTRIALIQLFSWHRRAVSGAFFAGV